MQESVQHWNKRNRDSWALLMSLGISCVDLGLKGCGSDSSCTPSGTTLTSTSIQVCFCSTPLDVGEGAYESGIALEVNGSTVGWALSNPVLITGLCLTYDVNQALSNGDAIKFQYDGSWLSPAAVDITVSNTL